MIELDLKNSLHQGLGQETYGILVVDDEEGLRALLSIGLRQHDFALWLAADGHEALELYRRHREFIDVALLDVRMPGQDGPQTLAALHEVNPQIRCCFMSGDLGSHTEEELRNLGAAAVLKKAVCVALATAQLSDLLSYLHKCPAPPTRKRMTLFD